MKINLIVVLFFSIITLGTCALPPEVIINPPTCSSHSQCPSFYFPKCDSGTNKCVHSCTNAICNRFSGSGQGNCVGDRCYVECSAANDPICQEMRAYCSLNAGDTLRCFQCGSNDDCQGAGYPGTIYCDDTTLGGVGVCSSCPPSGCPAGICQNFKCVECNNNGDCPPNKPVCEIKFEGNFCRGCLQSSDCSNPSKPICSGKTCITCSATSDCSARFPATPYCGPNGCAQCLQDSHCTSSSAPYCVGNTCQNCNVGGSVCSDRFSTTSPKKLACKGSTGTCVECTTDSHCTGASRYCVGNVCKKCSDDGTICSGRFSSTTPKKLACLGGTGVCVECVNDSYCTSPSAPYCVANTCQGCTVGGSVCSSRFSTSSPPKLACKASTGVCVECNNDSDCAGPSKYCVGNVCKKCSDDAGICSSRFSSTIPTKLACLGSTGICVECNGDSFCTTPSAPYCVGNSCYGCSFSSAICPDRFSTSMPAKIVCSNDGDVCVECQLNSHCPSVTKSYCNLGSAYCEPCFDNSQCYHISGKNKCFQGECYTYQEQCWPDYKVLVTQNLNIFTVKFPSALVSRVDIQASLSISFADISPADYSYILSPVASTKFILYFTFEKTVPATKLKLTLPCPSQPGYLYGNLVVNFNTEKVLYTTPGVQDAIETIESFTKTATVVMASISGSMILAGANPAILWALISLLQNFYYLVFINVEYPANVVPFLQLFTMGNLDFIPNPIGWFFPEIEYETLDAPQKFLDNEVDGLFFQTAGNMLLAWVAVSVGYVASFLLLKFTRNMPKLVNAICFKSVEIFEWSGVFRTMITSYTQLTMAAFLQVRILNYNSKLFSFSSIFGIIFVAFAGLVPFCTWAVIYGYYHKEKIMKRKFSTLIEDLRVGDSKCVLLKYFNVLFLLRRLVLVSTLVFLHNSPYLEIIILLISCIGWTIFLCQYLPYGSKLNNVINIFSEIVFTGIHILILLLIHGDYTQWLTDPERLNLGWGIIGGCGMILIATLIPSFVEQYFCVKRVWGLVRMVVKGKEQKKARDLRRFKHSRVNSEIVRLNDESFGTQNSSTLNVSREELVKKEFSKRSPERLRLNDESPEAPKNFIKTSKGESLKVERRIKRRKNPKVPLRRRR